MWATEEAAYAVIGREEGEDAETPHLQGYFRLKNPIRYFGYFTKRTADTGPLGPGGLALVRPPARLPGRAGPWGPKVELQFTAATIQESFERA